MILSPQGITNQHTAYVYAVSCQRVMCHDSCKARHKAYTGSVVFCFLSVLSSVLLPVPTWLVKRPQSNLGRYGLIKHYINTTRHTSINRVHNCRRTVCTIIENRDKITRVKRMKIYWESLTNVDLLRLWHVQQLHTTSLATLLNCCRSQSMDD